MTVASMLVKVRRLERDLQAYLKNLDLYEKRKIQSIPIREQKVLARSFLELAEVLESSLEENVPSKV